MSVKVPLPLLRYINGGGPGLCRPAFANSCFGTIRSRKPSPLMSPQIGLPHALVFMAIIPAAVDTLLNCCATDTDEKTVTNPAMVARRESAFLRRNGTRHNPRRPQRVDLMKDVNRGVFISGLFYQG